MDSKCKTLKSLRARNPLFKHCNKCGKLNNYIVFSEGVWQFQWRFFDDENGESRFRPVCKKCSDEITRNRGN